MPPLPNLPGATALESLSRYTPELIFIEGYNFTKDNELEQKPHSSSPLELRGFLTEEVKARQVERVCMVTK